MQPKKKAAAPDGERDGQMKIHTLPIGNWMARLDGERTKTPGCRWKQDEDFTTTGTS